MACDHRADLIADDEAPEQGLPSEPPQRRAAPRADAPDKRSTRSQRAHKERAPARAASARGEPERTPEPRASAPADAQAALPAPRAASEEQVSREGAPAPEPPRAQPKVRAQGPNDLEEMQQVATAEPLLERSPARALTLVRQGDERYAHGYFQQERIHCDHGVDSPRPDR